MFHLANIRFFIIVTEAFCQNTNAHFFENRVHPGSEKEDDLFKCTNYDYLSGENSHISRHSIALHEGERLYVISVSILK